MKRALSHFLFAARAGSSLPHFSNSKVFAGNLFLLFITMFAATASGQWTAYNDCREETGREITITTDTVGADIYFTTDSSNPIGTDGTPAPGAQLYNESSNKPYITTTCLRAAAVKADHIATNIDTHTYIFLDDVLTQGNGGSPSGYGSYSWGQNGPDYEMDRVIVNHSDPENQLTTSDMRAVPRIVVCMPKDDWFESGHGLYVTKALDGTEYPCSFEYFDPDGSGLNLQQNCAMSMQGGISGGGTSLNR